MKAKVSPPVVIKKYENRRLYNTLTSQYINQEQVAQLVRDGYDVRVIDAASGEDITRLILAQIVLEDAKTSDSALPLDVLRQMILASGKATQENALRYFKAMMEMYQTAYRAMPSPMNPFPFLPAVWGQTQGGEERTSGPEPVGTRGEQAPAGDASDARESEVNELRRRIEEMEAAMSRQRRGRKAGKAKSRRKA